MQECIGENYEIGNLIFCFSSTYRGLLLIFLSLDEKYGVVCS